MTEPRMRHNIVVVEDNYGALDAADHHKIDYESQNEECCASLCQCKAKHDFHKLTV